MKKPKDISFKQFYDEHNSRFGEFAFLFGNGLISSYPKDAPKHDDVLNSVAFNKSELEFVWKNVNEYFQAVFKIIPDEITPENLLNILRRVYSFYVFEQFIDKQRKLNASEIHTPRKFLKLFKSIYTLNYDYLTYVSIFKDSEGSSDKNSIKDGFYGSIPICLGHIENTLSTGKPFRFLHGAFHIFQQYEDGVYYKVSSDWNGNFLEKVKKKYDAIRSDITHLLDPDVTPQDNPIIVFAGKSRDKLAMIKDNTYLDSCLTKLGSEDKIFTFGCSFERDSHILDTIFERDHIAKEVFLGWYEEKDKTTIEKYLRNKHDGYHIKVYLVEVSKEQQKYIDKYIWNKGWNLFR